MLYQFAKGLYEDMIMNCQTIRDEMINVRSIWKGGGFDELMNDQSMNLQECIILHCILMAFFRSHVGNIFENVLGLRNAIPWHISKADSVLKNWIRIEKATMKEGSAALSRIFGNEILYYK